MAKKRAKSKKTDYLLFCEKCGVPQPIPNYILQTYFVTEVSGVYCGNCNYNSKVPDYLKKISDEL